MGKHSCWRQQQQREERSKSHRHRAHYVNLIAAPAGSTTQEALQALGTDLAEGSGLGARSGVSHAKEVGYQKTEMLQRICGSLKNVS